ncbi:hypothetical protein BSL78_21391 [Apostichopus japonicus]|uniref:Uncharacterized protein n=1 Tax=Stichopus japonicus TaxID=307972 RepID=A0A2G8K190_STIJA|nr:hypothetical protein BSL78_21391 [Apostichopus japonicus]
MNCDNLNMAFSSDHENEETDEHDDVEKDGTLGEEEKKEDTSANKSDPQEESSDTVVSSADKEPPINQDNTDDKVSSVSETSPVVGQSAVQSDPVKAEITNQFKTQSEEIQEEKTSAGSVSHTGEGLLQTFDDSLRPYTCQTLTDRPVSISSFVYSAKDFPTPDTSNMSGPLPLWSESDNDRPESKASRAMKSGTSRGDGTKSVTFADDVKSDEIGKQDSEGPQEDDSVTDKEELFSTAVSEEKIEEATKKLRMDPQTARDLKIVY